MSGRFRVLVAGGAGLVGAAVAEQLLSESAEVIVADVLGDWGDGRTVREARVARLQRLPGATVARVDLTAGGAAAALLGRHEPAAIVNAAVFPPDGPGAAPLLAAARTLSEPPFFLHLSDGSLHGPPAVPDAPAREDEPLEPGDDPAARLHAREEELVRESGLPFTVLRLFELLAPGLPAGRFPTAALEAVLAGSEAVLPDDAPRDYLALEDAVAGILAALARRAAGETFNLASGRAVRPSDVVRLLGEKAFRPVRVRAAGPPARVPRIADVEKAWEGLRFRPRRTLDFVVQAIVADRLGSREAATTKRRPGGLPAPPPEPDPEPPRNVSRRELFGLFRGPIDRARRGK